MVRGILHPSSTLHTTIKARHFDNYKLNLKSDELYEPDFVKNEG